MPNHSNRLGIKACVATKVTHGPARVRLSRGQSSNDTILVCRYLPCSAGTRVTIIGTLVPDEVARSRFFVYKDNHGYIVFTPVGIFFFSEYH